MALPLPAAPGAAAARAGPQHGPGQGEPSPQQLPCPCPCPAPAVPAPALLAPGSGPGAVPAPGPAASLTSLRAAGSAAKSAAPGAGRGPGPPAAGWARSHAFSPAPGWFPASLNLPSLHPAPGGHVPHHSPDSRDSEPTPQCTFLHPSTPRIPTADPSNAHPAGSPISRDPPQNPGLTCCSPAPTLRIHIPHSSPSAWAPHPAPHSSPAPGAGLELLAVPGPCQAGAGGNAVEFAESSQKYLVLYFHLKAKALQGSTSHACRDTDGAHGWGHRRWTRAAGPTGSQLSPSSARAPQLPLQEALPSPGMSTGTAQGTRGGGCAQ